MRLQKRYIREKIVVLLQSVLIVALFFAVVIPVSAQTVEEMDLPSATVTQSASGTPILMKEKEVEYTLPYPGMLPDNPLYFLKQFRDQVVSFLITDPLKKSEFHLLQADKKLQTAVYLEQQQKKDAIVVHSAVSAEDHFEQAIQKLEGAEKMDLPVEELARTLETAAKKHKIVLEKLVKGVGTTEQKTLKKQIQRVQEFQKDAGAIIQKTQDN